MANVLVTGASGYLGRRLVQAATSAGHRVIALSRKPVEPQTQVTPVRGDFASFENLRLLDHLPIDAAVHLAAETGGCSEEAGIETNVAGTRRLMRYLLDRGCRRFVVASSIAAVGSLDAGFVPQRLPIPDEHPCLARDAYGLSKALMEQVLAYFARTHPDATIITLRIGAVVAPNWQDKPRKAGSFTWGPFADLARVMDADVIAGLLAALNSPARPGMRLYNLVGPDVAADDPVVPVVRGLTGPAADVDTSWYARDGHQFDPVYDLRKIASELGFMPTHSVRRTEESP